MLKHIHVLAVAGVMILGSGCKKDEPQPSDGIIKLGPNTTWISEATAQLLVEVDSVQVIFQGTSSELDDQQVGDIIVSGIAPNAPYGYLRKITQKQKVGDQYIFQTVEVSLSEAFEELNVSYSRAFAPGDTLSGDGKTEDVRFNIDFLDVVIYDVDGDTNTTADQVSLSGSISFVPNIEVAVNITQFQLQHAKIEGTFETELSSSLTVGGSLNVISGTLTVFQKPLAPFTLPGTPIVIVPKVRVKLGANGSASISLQGTVSGTNSVSAFVEFDNGAWQTGHSRDMSYSYSFSGITGTVNAKGYVEPGLDFTFFGSNNAKGGVTAQGFLKFKADLIPDPTCNLKAGVSAGMNAKLQIFGTSFGAVAYPELFSHEAVLFTCSGTGTGNPPTAAFTASSTSITAGQSVNFTDQSAGSPTSWQWTFQGGTPGSSTSQNPSGITYSTPGTYNVALTASNANGSDTKTMNGYITVTQQGGGSITSLNCNSATNSGALTAGTAASGVSSSVPYTGGNGGTYSAQSVSSTGVTGLTATLAAGTFATGSGTLTYTITGTPSTSGTAGFALNIGGQNCVLNRTVASGGGIVTNPGAGVTDIDGNSYPTIILGNGQEWMAENLRTATYRNADPIPTGLNNNQWFNTSAGAYAHYNSNPNYDVGYGKLYNWHAVGDARNVCPVGWHVPTDAEWIALTDYLGGLNVAGGKMKTTGTIQAGTGVWQSPNTGATNASGLSGFSGGTRNSNGQFEYVGYNGYYWSATEDGWNNAWYRPLNANNGNTSRYSYFKNMGFSIRCVKD